jgi:hypothetical protein
VAQAASHRRLVAEIRILSQVSSCGICGEQSGIGTSSRVLRFTLSLSFRRGFQCSNITLGINNRPVCGRSSETSSQSIDMNNNNLSNTDIHTGSNVVH